MVRCFAGLCEKCKFLPGPQMEIRKNDEYSGWQRVDDGEHIFLPNEVAQVRCRESEGHPVSMYGPEFVVCLPPSEKHVANWSTMPECVGEPQPYPHDVNIPNHQVTITFDPPYDYQYQVDHLGEGKRALKLIKNGIPSLAFPPGRACYFDKTQRGVMVRRNINGEWIDHWQAEVFWHNEIVQFKCPDNEIPNPEFAVCRWGVFNTEWTSCFASADDMVSAKYINETAPNGYTFKVNEVGDGVKNLLLVHEEDNLELPTFPFIDNCPLYGEHLWGRLQDHDHSMSIEQAHILQHGQSMRLSCEFGRVLEGSQLVHCIDGHLFPELPLCRENCPLDGEHLWGRLQEHDSWMSIEQIPILQHGQSIQLSCGRGKFMEGSPLVDCIDGQFSPELPLCRENCPLDGEHLWGRLQEHDSWMSIEQIPILQHGQSIQLSCGRGKFMEGSPLVDCIDGQFSPELPLCRDFTAIAVALKENVGHRVPSILLAGFLALLTVLVVLYLLGVLPPIC